MKELKKKWNSSRGATIFLALLFMLMCVMVGASVLAAAASNAGKSQINKEQQQDYYTVSSALNYVCDVMKEVGYVGRYQYVRSARWVLDDPEDETSLRQVPGSTTHYFDQRQGELVIHGDLETSNATAVGEALSDLLDGMDNIMDNIFDRYFRGDEENIHYKNTDRFIEDGHDDLIPSPAPSILEEDAPWQFAWDFQVTVPSADPVPDLSSAPDLSDLEAGHFEPVNIHAILDTDGNIIFTAEIASGYRMEAKMKPDLGGFTLKDKLQPDINLINDPVDFVDPDAGINYSTRLNRDTSGPDGIKWTLEYIKKGTT